MDNYTSKVYFDKFKKIKSNYKKLFNFPIFNNLDKNLDTFIIN